MNEGESTGSEDCLYISVFTRHLGTTARRPVLVFFHGGAFIFGGTTMMTGQYLLEQDLVLVTVQYRLGPFGFLTLEDSTVPGNLGLLDQVASLQWVHQHIAQFGGDPGLVTVAGLSAGAASVHYLLQSPLTDGLIHRAVLLSGSSLCWWADLPGQASTARTLAGRLGCPTSPSLEVLTCLRKQEAEQIMEAQGQLYSWHPGILQREPMNIWSPRHQPGGKVGVELRQRVPMLVGVDETEGAWRAAAVLGREFVLEDFITNFREVAPLVLGLKDQVEPTKHEQ